MSPSFFMLKNTCLFTTGLLSLVISTSREIPLTSMTKSSLSSSALVSLCTAQRPKATWQLQCLIYLCDYLNKVNLLPQNPWSKDQVGEGQACSLSLHCVPRPYHSDSYNAFQNICCANECKCISSWPLFCVICSDDSRKLQTFQKDWNKNKYYRSNFSQLSLKKHQAFLNHGWVKCQIQISILEIHRQNKQFEWLLLTSWLTRLFTFTINLNCLWTDPNTTSD